MEYNKIFTQESIVYFCEIDKIQKTEIWKDVKGYECLYQVSDLGRIKSLPVGKIRKGKIITINSIFFILKVIFPPYQVKIILIF